MWYLIIALIMFAFEWAFLFAFDRAETKRLNHLSTIVNDLSELGPWAVVFIIGAALWPIVILILLGVISFKTVLKKPFENLSNWIYEHM